MLLICEFLCRWKQSFQTVNECVYPPQWLELQPCSRSGVSRFDGHQDSGQVDVSGGGRSSRSLHQPHVGLQSRWKAPRSRQGQQTHLLPGLPQHGGGLLGLQQPERCQAAGAALHSGTRCDSPDRCFLNHSFIQTWCSDIWQELLALMNLNMSVPQRPKGG